MASATGVSSENNNSHEIHGTQPQVDLPVEIIIYIMEHLTLSDRKSASQVCQTWYEASRDQKLHKKEVVVLHDNFNESLDCLLASTGTFINFLFKEVELNAKLLPFWDKFCPQLQSLAIHNCVVAEKMFVDILSRCYHIENLSLSSCRELLMSGRVLETEADIVLLRKTLVKLKELSLTYNRYMSDAILYRFISIAPNIQELALTGCQITFHHGLYQKFYPPAMIEENSLVLSESVLTFNLILKFIKDQAQKLRVLKLGHTLVDNSALTELAKVPGLNLICLHLQSCNQLTNVGLIELANHQTTLTELDLSGCARLTDSALIVICKSLVNLKNLNIRNCRAVTNIGVGEIIHLKNLEYLNLAQCEAVTGEGVITGVCPKQNLRLKSLNLCALLMDEESVCKVAENLPGLQYLDLGWCINAMTDKSAQAICTNLLYLRTLKLTSCNKVSDAGITGIRIMPPDEHLQTAMELVDSENESWSDTLHKINLRSRAEREIVEDANRKRAVYEKCIYPRGTEFDGKCLDRIQGLRFLDISGCNRITDVGLQYAFHFPGLQCLDLSRCQQVTHVGLYALATSNPSINTLTMVECFNLTDEAILAVVQHLKRLKHLDVQGCNLLSDGSLDAIEKHSTALQYVNINNCTAMTMAAAVHLEQSLPTLRTLHRGGLRADQYYTSRSDSILSSPPPPPPPPGKKNLFACFHR